MNKPEVHVTALQEAIRRRDEEIATLRLRIQELERQVEKDPHTGLYNRVAFINRVEREQSRLRHEARGDSVAVLVLDIDRLKYVNDNFGHPAGDELIDIVSRAITASLRPDDVAARLGGDEFAVMLRYTDSWGAHAVCGRLMQMLHSKPLALHCERTESYEMVQVSASIGGCVWTPASSANSGVIIRQADAAMYEYKNARRRGQPNLSVDIREI